VYFQADQESPLYDAIRTIVRRTTGAPEVIRRNLADLDGVGLAFVYGSYARGEETPTSDVDLMIVGSPDVDQLTDRVAAAEGEIGRPINYTILTADEIERRRHNRDAVMASIDANPTLPVIDRA
jgi:predicted nucleotidyltransferase